MHALNTVLFFCMVQLYIFKSQNQLGASTARRSMHTQFVPWHIATGTQIDQIAPKFNPQKPHEDDDPTQKTTHGQALAISMMELH